MSLLSSILNRVTTDVALPQKVPFLVRLLLTSILFAVPVALPAGAQEVQLHYDWRHSVDPRNNARNFPALTFKDFKSMEFGSFLIKVEADLNGSRNNVSKVYSEISQTLKFWLMGQHLPGLQVHQLHEGEPRPAVFDLLGEGIFQQVGLCVYRCDVDAKQESRRRIDR